MNQTQTSSTELSLKNAAVVVDANEPSYVQYAVKELRDQVGRITSLPPLLFHDLQAALETSEVKTMGRRMQVDTLIVVGRPMADRLVQEIPGQCVPTDDAPGPQGFVLKVWPPHRAKNIIIAAGSDSAGTNYAVLELRQRVAESASGATVPARLDLTEKPRFKTRGVYIHQHWRYNYPYATWTWSVEEWKKAIDICACLRINLLMVWMHMDMIAPPLSVEEKEHLAQWREIVDYAHRARGMEMWSAEPANVVIDDPQIKALPLEERDYYAYAHRESGASLNYPAKEQARASYPPGPAVKNPADKKAFAALMANRTAFYRGVPDFDGIVFIDYDPGGWPGSPVSELVDIFVGNRQLLDELHPRPNEVKLINWMWGRWGTSKDLVENWREAIQQFRQRLKEPWELMIHPWFLKVPQDDNCLEKTVFLPYGHVELEPWLPITYINFGDSISKADCDLIYHLDRHEDLGQIMEQTYAAALQAGGIMGNVINLVLFLPNLYYFSQNAWRTLKDVDSRSIFESLARKIFPQNGELLAQCWQLLAQSGSDAVLKKAAELETAVEKGAWGRLGVLGDRIFPQADIICRDLVYILRIHGHSQRFHERVHQHAAKDEICNSLGMFLQAMLEWQKRCGFWGSYGKNKQIIWNSYVASPAAALVAKMWKEFSAHRDDATELQQQILNMVKEQDFDPDIMEVIAGQVFGNSSPRDELTQAMD